MKFSNEFSEVRRLIDQKDSILLAVHERPDGDALGSMIAMFSILEQEKGKGAIMFSKDPVPENLKFLPHSDKIVHDFGGGGFSPDLFFGFDYADFKRLGVKSDSIKDAQVVTFDHHPYLRQIGDVLIIDSDASSTCEIVYRFFRELNYHISSDTATSLLTGIFTDTGGFAHVNTSVATLNAVEDLLRCGASMRKLKKNTFSNKSPRVLRVWGSVLRNILFDADAGMAYVAISREEFLEMGSRLDDFDGIVNIINMPPDVRFSLLLIEHRHGAIKGSMRSEPFKKVDVSVIANALGGGGHKYAAGFELEGETLKNAIKRVKICASELV